MGLITWAKKVIGMIFKRQAEEDFNVESVVSPEMESKIAECANIYRGTPYWVNADDNVKTINFAKAICSETARLATLAIGIQIDGNARAAWLQEQIDKTYFQIRHWVEYGMAYGTIILKPNGKGLDIFTPMDFIKILLLLTVTMKVSMELCSRIATAKMISIILGLSIIGLPKSKMGRTPITHITYPIELMCLTLQKVWGTR
mgnify:CR=1 FL=1